MLQATSRLSRLLVRALGPVAALSLVTTADLAAQITPARPPITQPSPVVTREIPTLAAPDLVIDLVQMAPRVTPDALLADAFVTVRNAGSLDAPVRQGTVLVSGAAADSRGLRFVNALAASDFVLKPGEKQVAVLRSADPCTAGYGPFPVTFQADPQGTVAERVRTNNSSVATPPVADPANADLVVSALALQYGKDPRDNRSPAYLLVATLRNNGSAPALFCPGMTLARQTATPVSAKYGMQSSTFAQPATGTPPPATNTDANAGRVRTDYMPPMINIVIMPGGTRDVHMLACKSGDLPPGIYEWKVKVNPDGAARESNTGNNEFSAQLQGCQ